MKPLYNGGPSGTLTSSYLDVPAVATFISINLKPLNPARCIFKKNATNSYGFSRFFRVLPQRLFCVFCFPQKAGSVADDPPGSIYIYIYLYTTCICCLLVGPICYLPTTFFGHQKQLVGGFFPPIRKIYSSKWIHLPQFSG